MPDDPISTTPNLELGQWAEGANPGADALNENYGKIDTAVGNLDTAVSAKAAQSQVDSIDGRVDDLETADAENVKRDGSVPMTGDLDLDGNTIKGVASGAAADEAVNRGQLDAVEAAIVAAIGIPVVARVKRTTDQTMGAGGGIVSFDTEEIDSPGGAVDIGSHPTRLTAPQDGIYMFRFLAETNATQGAVQIRKNGGGDLEWYDDIFSANGYGFQGAAFNEIFGPVVMSAGDYVEFHSNNTSTGTDGSIQFVTARIPVMAAMFLINSAAVGGGDFMKDGSVAMTGDLDLGGFKGVNADDGVASDDLATVGQMQTADQDLQDQIDLLGGALTRQTPEAEVASGGIFSFGTSWSELTASRIDFTLAATTKVSAHGEASAVPDILQRASAQIGIRVQAMVAGNPSGSPVDYKGTYVSTAASGESVQAGVIINKPLSLAAGNWRISLIFRKADALANSAGVQTNSDFPARLWLDYWA